MGTAIAWVLVRDRFLGKRAPRCRHRRARSRCPPSWPAWCCSRSTGPQSPLGIHVANTRHAVFLALAFVTLPFVVRTVQPVLRDARPRRRGGRRVARREPADRLPPHHPALARCRRSPPAPRSPSPGRSASTARWSCCRATCPTRTEVASVRDLHLHRERRPGRRRGRRRDPARGRAARDRAARRDPAEGGPPWRLARYPRDARRRAVGPAARRPSATSCCWSPGRPFLVFKRAPSPPGVGAIAERPRRPRGRVHALQPDR